MLAAIGNFVAAFSVDTKVNISRNTFYPGNIVEGVVIVTTTKPVSVRAIRVKLVGRELASVVVRAGKRSTRYTSKACFLKELVTLAGSLKHGPQGDYWTIEPGTYSYPFAFQLPVQGLPASFMIRHGESFGGVTYQVKAYVDIPNGCNAASRAPFSLLRPLRLDQWINPMPVSQDRNFDLTCCCCISKGTNAARFFMDRTNISLDRDKIEVCVDIDNTNAKEPVDAVEVSLIQCGYFNGRGHTRNTQEEVVTVRLAQKIEAGAKGRVTGTLLLATGAAKVMAPSSATAIVYCSYIIKINLDVPWADDPYHAFNVTVGVSVDEANLVPPLLNENTTVMLQKGQLSVPEKFYAPPPAAVYQYVPIPNGDLYAKGAPVPQYNLYAIAPSGYPGAQWNGQPPVAPGNEENVTMPLGLQWSQGFEPRSF